MSKEFFDGPLTESTVSLIEPRKHTPYRRTGRTFRRLLESLRRASEGETIAYVCSNNQNARWTFEKAVRIANDFMEPDIPKKGLLKIGDGLVFFTGEKSDERISSRLLGRNFTKIIDLYLYLLLEKK